MKATVSNAIKAYDHTVKSHIRKIQAQQTVIDEAQNEIRNCQASIQTAQKCLVHQISAIVERRKDAGEISGGSPRAIRAKRRAEHNDDPQPIGDKGWPRKCAKRLAVRGKPPLPSPQQSPPPALNAGETPKDLENQFFSCRDNHMTHPLNSSQQ